MYDIMTRLIVLAVWAAIGLVHVEPANAELISGALVNTTSTTMEIYKRTQKEKERWALQKTELIKRRNSLSNDMEDMTTTRAELEAMIEKTGASIKELKRKPGAKTGGSIVEIERLLWNLIQRIEARLREGLPFLLKERGMRIEVLRALMDDAHAGLAEKYRRVMEAVLIEMEYARTVEVYQEAIEVNGERLTANVLRIGSAALFYQSPDGLNVGRFSGPGGVWEPLPAKYASGIGRAMQIARHQRAAEIIDLPVGRPVR
jgi:hypothetical protein